MPSTFTIAMFGLTTLVTGAGISASYVFRRRTRLARLSLLGALLSGLIMWLILDRWEPHFQAHQIDVLLSFALVCGVPALIFICIFPHHATNGLGMKVRSWVAVLIGVSMWLVLAFFVSLGIACMLDPQCYI